MSGSLDSVLRSLDVPSLTPVDARAVLRAAVAIEKRACALKLLVASRSMEDEGWAGSGARSAADWLASESGSSFGEAQATLGASEAANEIPELGAAVREGELSGEQARQVGGAATPENVGGLLDEAKKGDVGRLRRKCNDEKSKQRSDEDERTRAEKAHRERATHSAGGTDGVWRFDAKGRIIDGSIIDACIDAEAEVVFKEAWAAGQRDTRANYRFDALKRLILRGAGAVESSSPVKVQVVMRIDAARLVGGVGLCETLSGPIPVDDVVRAIIEGASVASVVRQGIEITKLTTSTRHIKAALRLAVMEQHDWRCIHCGTRHGLELHHVVPYAAGGPTCFTNLAPLCTPSHDMCSNDGATVRGSPGLFEWVPPAASSRRE